VKKHYELQLDVLVHVNDHDINKNTVKSITRAIVDKFEDVFVPQEIKITIDPKHDDIYGAEVEVRSLMDNNMDDYTFDPDLTETVQTAIREMEE
jgi:hypothetical protein